MNIAMKILQYIQLLGRKRVCKRACMHVFIFYSYFIPFYLVYCANGIKIDFDNDKTMWPFINKKHNLNCAKYNIKFTWFN